MDILPDEVLFHILTRLPAKSIHRFKSVSKRWYSLICNPRFISSYISCASTSPPSLHIVDRHILLSPHSVSTQLELVSAPNVYAAYAKEEGNELFMGGRFDEAIISYSRSITLSATAPAYANRALAHLKMSRFQEAEDDCTYALSLDGDYVKAYGRRAIARLELGNLQGSTEDIEHALKLEPNNKGMKKQYSEIKYLLEKEQA